MARIFIGNLDFEAKADSLRTLFEPLGTVQKVDIATDWETGHSRGFAILEMQDGDAETAIRELNGVKLHGRALTVRSAPALPPMGFDSLSLGG